MKKRLLILAAILLCIGIAGWTVLWLLSDNTTLGITTYRVSSSKLPAAFDGYRIAQISDLHNTEFGEDNKELLELLAQSEPDIIVFTGDLIDSMRTDMDIAIALAREAMKIAPCYMINGNHEASITTFKDFHTALRAEGVIVLRDQSVPLEHQGSSITLLGLDDPTLSCYYPEEGSEAVVYNVLGKMCEETEGYRILLAHHPELIDIYARHGVDLVLSGHAHGGQIRLGKYGGIIAPHQGFFPEYDAGEYHRGNTTMILSRGLGNSKFPFRINNPPELVLLELAK